jgi:hypothetical protein
VTKLLPCCHRAIILSRSNEDLQNTETEHNALTKRSTGIGKVGCTHLGRQTRRTEQTLVAAAAMTLVRCIANDALKIESAKSATKIITERIQRTGAS